MSRPVPTGLYRAAAIVLCLAAAAGIAVLLIADTADEASKFGVTAGLLLAFGFAAAVGISITGRFPIALVGWLCVVASAVAFGFLMRVLWGEFLGEGWLKATGGVVVFSFALGLISSILGRLQTGDGALVKRLVALTVLTTLVTATLLTIAIVAELRDEPYYRVTVVVAVLSALGTALVPVMRAMRQAAY
jgi:hypothetical protein